MKRKKVFSKKLRTIKKHQIYKCQNLTILNLNPLAH